MGMFHKPIFGATIQPACEYCSYGRPSPDPNMVICHKGGYVWVKHHCRRFDYDPLRRVPRRPPRLPSFSPEDFSLD